MVQKKKSDEQDVLVVRDEKTGEISVVAGLSRDGTPKRAPAKAENTPRRRTRPTSCVLTATVT